MWDSVVPDGTTMDLLLATIGGMGLALQNFLFQNVQHASAERRSSADAGTMASLLRRLLILS